MKILDAPPPEPEPIVDPNRPRDKAREHPWKTTTEAAMRGELPSGEKIGEAASRAGKVAVGIESPKTFDEWALNLAAMTPVMAAGGAAGEALNVGRGLGMVGTGALAGGGGAAARGEGPGGIALGTGLGAAGAALPEIPGAVKAGAKKVAGAAMKTPRIVDALNLIKSRIGAGADGPTNLQTFTTWMKRFVDAPHAMKKIVADQIEEFLGTAEPKVGGVGLDDPIAAQLFKENVSKAIPRASVMQEFAERIPSLKNPALRAGVAAQGEQGIPGTHIPVGAGLEGLAANLVGARHIPFVGKYVRPIADVVSEE